MSENQYPITYISKCKVCRIQKFDQQLFNHLHSLKFTDDKSLAFIVNEVNEDFKKKKYPVDELNEQNLSTHFSKHIPVDLIAQYKQLSTKTRVTKPRSSNQETTLATQEHITALVKEKETLYDKLEELYKVLNQRFKDFDNEQGNKVNLFTVDSYATLSKELRGCLSELNKMKQGEQLIKIILQNAFQQYTVGILQGIIKEIDTLKTGLKVYVKDPETIERMTSNLQLNLGEVLITHSKLALDTIKDTYKIH